MEYENPRYEYRKSGKPMSVKTGGKSAPQAYKRGGSVAKASGAEGKKTVKQNY